MKNNRGVSLIILIISIVVIIILTTIMMNTSSDVPDKAHYTNYLQVMKNVQTGVDNVKIQNARKGVSEEKLTAGFQKVYLEEAPAAFVSFGDIHEPITGYIVNLEKIAYTNAEFGGAYRNYLTEDDIPTVTFGKEASDVYIIDATWTVFYAKGLKYDGSMNYYIQ